MRSFKIFTLILAAAALAAGCADVKPSIEEMIKHPIGTDSVKVGMTKDRVRDIWGEPDSINFVKDKKRWGGEREEWIYKAEFSALPINASYLSKTKKLYFDGNNLTNIVEE